MAMKCSYGSQSEPEKQTRKPMTVCFLKRACSLSSFIGGSDMLNFGYEILDSPGFQEYHVQLPRSKEILLLFF